MRFSGRLSLDRAKNQSAVLVERLAAEGKPVLNLSEYNPTKCGLLVGGIVEALSDPDNIFYQPDPRGTLKARQVLSKQFEGSPDSYFLTASTSESYSWIFKLLCDPGDVVLVPRPGYPLFEHLASLESIEAVPYQLEYEHPMGWSIDTDEIGVLAKKNNARAVVVINPNNPTGSYVSGEERDAIVSLCSDHGMALIADEVFHPYRIEAESLVPRIGNETGCLTFSLDGLSKRAGSPQLKLGWMGISGPNRDVEEAVMRMELVADTYLSASTPVMNALPVLMELTEPFIWRVRQRLLENLAQAHTIFGGRMSPYRVLRCDGGWTVLVEFPRYQGEEEAVLGLLRECHVAVQPGYFFDIEREGCLALSLILEPRLFREGAEIVRGYIDSLGI